MIQGTHGKQIYIQKRAPKIIPEPADPFCTVPPGTVAEDASAAVASPSCATITFCSPPVLVLVLVLVLLLLLVRLNAPLAVTLATRPAVPPLWLDPPLLEALVRDVDLKSSLKTLETKCTYNLVIIEMK